ncbi:hypothetical protein NG798_25070 [Ancylothrix sp. C2]|nr:hypothetical protein [Ancylothrix sp. D3o]
MFSLRARSEVARPARKNIVPVSVTIPSELKDKLVSLAEYPYGTISNAAVVLMKKGLETEKLQDELTFEKYLEILPELSEEEISILCRKCGELLLMQMEKRRQSAK